MGNTLETSAKNDTRWNKYYCCKTLLFSVCTTQSTTPSIKKVFKGLETPSGYTFLVFLEHSWETEFSFSTHNGKERKIAGKHRHSRRQMRRGRAQHSSLRFPLARHYGLLGWDHGCRGGLSCTLQDGQQHSWLYPAGATALFPRLANIRRQTLPQLRTNVRDSKEGGETGPINRQSDDDILDR